MASRLVACKLAASCLKPLSGAWVRHEAALWVVLWLCGLTPDGRRCPVVLLVWRSGCCAVVETEHDHNEEPLALSDSSWSKRQSETTGILVACEIVQVPLGTHGVQAYC